MGRVEKDAMEKKLGKEEEVVKKGRKEHRELFLAGMIANNSSECASTPHGLQQSQVHARRFNVINAE